MEDAFDAFLVFVSFFFVAGVSFSLGLMVVAKLFKVPLIGITFNNHVAPINPIDREP
jgi:hypothetical protein